MQGSRSAPLSWARLAALVMRLTQSLFDDDKVSLHCFVDDPVAVIKGTLAEPQEIVIAMVLVWEALYFKLAYKKRQYGKSVVWIGAELASTPEGILATVKDTIVEDIVADLVKFDGHNVISRKELRSFVGRANHAAGFLVAVRQFLHSIWGALSAPEIGPTNTVWTKQIAHALGWLNAFSVLVKWTQHATSRSRNIWVLVTDIR